MDDVNSSSESKLISRRRALAQIGGAGALALLGAGLLDAIGVRSASAQTSAGSASKSKSSPRSASPAITCPPGEYYCDLAEFHCGAPCPPGFYCYNCRGIYDCLPSNGEPQVCV